MIISKNKGFTLIELMVVLSIIALLSSIVYASLQSTRVSARDAVRMQQVRQMDLAIGLFKSDHNGAVPNLASVSGGGCSYSNPSNAGNCVAKSSGGEAWNAFVSEIQPYMKTVPVGTHGIDFVYMAPASMGSAANDSSYQVSANLEKNPSAVFGYTSGNTLISYPPGGPATYSITFHAMPSSGDSTGCMVMVGNRTVNCNSTISGLTNGTYSLTYMGGYILPPDAAGVSVGFWPMNPAIINSANIDIDVTFVLFAEAPVDQ